MGRFLIVGKVLQNHQRAMRIIHNAKCHLNSHSVGGWILQARYLPAIWFLHKCSSERPAFFPCTGYALPFQASFPTAIPHHPHILLINVMEIGRRAYILSTSFFFCLTFKQDQWRPSFSLSKLQKAASGKFPGRQKWKKQFFQVVFHKVHNTGWEHYVSVKRPCNIIFCRDWLLASHLHSHAQIQHGVAWRTYIFLC